MYSLIIILIKVGEQTSDASVNAYNRSGDFDVQSDVYYEYLKKLI